MSEFEKLLHRPFHYILDKRGTPVPVITRLEDGSFDRDPLLAWAAWMENIENRRLLLTSQSTGTSPRPWTMVYTEHENQPRTWWDTQRRYRSESSARDGHATIVRAVKGKLGGT